MTSASKRTDLTSSSPDLEVPTNTDAIIAKAVGEATVRRVRVAA